MTWFVYVLQSQKDSAFYIGISSDVQKRLQSHNKGNTRSTKSRRPFKLLYTEKYATRKEARKREKYLKSGCGREWLKRAVVEER
jgi:putative endonuclease